MLIARWMLWLGLALSLLPGRLLAADILDMPGSPYINALVSGPIEPGDTDKLQKFLEKKWSHGPEGGEFGAGGPYAHVYFDSSGGSLAEALRMGAFLRDSLVASVVAEGQRCSGACAWAFLGGSSGFVTGGHRPDRELDGQLTFERFANKFGEPDIAELTAYAVRMDVSLHFLTRVLATKPQEVLTVDSLDDLGQDRPTDPDRGSPARWAVTLCNQATDWRHPLAIESSSSTPYPVAKVVPLTVHETAVTLFSAATHNPAVANGPIGRHIRDALKSKPEDLDDLLRQVDEYSWLFDFDPQLPPLVYLVTGWRKERNFDVTGCLVIIGRRYYSSTKVILMRPQGNVLRRPHDDSGISYFYRKRSYY